LPAPIVRTGPKAPRPRCPHLSERGDTQEFGTKFGRQPNALLKACKTPWRPRWCVPVVVEAPMAFSLSVATRRPPRAERNTGSMGTTENAAQRRGRTAFRLSGWRPVCFARSGRRSVRHSTRRYFPFRNDSLFPSSARAMIRLTPSRFSGARGFPFSPQ
jgi:hypothetical protein